MRMALLVVEAARPVKAQNRLSRAASERVTRGFIESGSGHCKIPSFSSLRQVVLDPTDQRRIPPSPPVFAVVCASARAVSRPQLSKQSTRFLYLSWLSRLRLP